MTRKQRVSMALWLISFAPGAQAQPEPLVVDPGGPGRAPSDAIVLFDGKNLAEWAHEDGSPAKWTIAGGVLVCKSGTGHLYSKRRHGSAQIHVEFSTPLMAEATSQARGNSGVYLQNRYEIQILDSYRNPTYAVGAAGAVYGQYAPLVNPSRPPGQWQTYDIIFHAATCGPDGKVTRPGTVTLLYNGVLVQDHVTLKGVTGGGAGDDLCQPGPLMLQDHFHPNVKETFLRFRNIWFRPLPD